MLVNYNEEVDIDENEEEIPKIVGNPNVNPLEILEIIDESDDKSNNEFERNITNNNNDILFNIGNNISNKNSIKKR